jgi:hypothetical protein
VEVEAHQVMVSLAVQPGQEVEVLVDRDQVGVVLELPHQAQPILVVDQVAGIKHNHM